jgi:GDP-4-dehydro-6-deoxy-D-mannose reductase
MTEPVLVTGAAGFAGRHLLTALRRKGQTVSAWRRPGSEPRHAAPDLGIGWQDIDVLDRASVRSALRALEPATIYHCAGAANVHRSWGQTFSTLETNILGTLNLLEEVRTLDRRPRILIPGSALVYRPSAAAIAEDAPIGPVSPYGLSKLAQEMLAARFGSETETPVLLARSFTHVGPGQDPSYSASSFARQLALIEAGQAEPTLAVGNLSARRDLSDVRDTVAAYILLVERGTPGRPYNVCSGIAHEIGEVLEGLLSQARVKVAVVVDPQHLRPNDNPLLLGDPTRITTEIGWRPVIPLHETLRDLLDYWRDFVRTRPARPAMP